MNDGDRAVALRAQLAQLHQSLLDRVDELREGRPLLAHCLAFCAALTRHHRAEDEGLFAELVRVRPGLAPAVAKLMEDHQLIAMLLARVEAATDPDAAARELDGLAAIMQSHFAFEERALREALDDPALSQRKELM
ncbi:hemerythrin domain-containing protein [Dactylosporangium sp. AC04546]|uniref:hemerythrin domain-containing protein n=1 Tax=Dactylosporangium sp. AC04546 TaxID=2862460 RepID=UPI001EDFF343|nr:hemerythrin domain-containing protein [Dactylosporangium sp. AC04546]WVK79941.1 hemerythrin domain-containing protein [Dactylosporangium sp. AC04546]